MGNIRHIQTLFSARQAIPSIERVDAAGIIHSQEPLRFLHRGVSPLDFTLFVVELENHPQAIRARAIVHDHHPDMVGRNLSGQLFEDRASYEGLLRGTDPRPSYIHAIMLEQRGLYFKPDTLNIDGLGLLSAAQKQPDADFSLFPA